MPDFNNTYLLELSETAILYDKMASTMKIFVSYKFTGEDPNELAETIGQIVDRLRSVGHDVYCSLEDEAWFRQKKRTNQEIMEHALAQLDTCDLLLAFVRSSEKVRAC